MGRDELAHDAHGIGIGVHERSVRLEVAVLIARDIEIALADIVDAIIAQGPARVALNLKTTSSPGLIKVSSPPPSAPVEAWKSMLWVMTFVAGFTSVSS